jgi:trans-aconitate 2-methyltransferase
MAALEPQERAEFLGLLAPKLASAYPRRPDGTTFFPFRRLFILASP